MNFRSGIVIFLFAVVAIFISVPWQENDRNMYSNDVAGYYLYVPATFIYKDLAFVDFQVKRFPNDIGWLHTQPDGKQLDKYTMGVSIMHVPFFAAAHAYTSVNSKFPCDGYSFPYQIAGRLASIFYTILGLLLLSLFLRNYYRPTIVAAVLCCIAFGTNLFYYTVYEPGMSHPFSFCLFAAVLHLTNLWYRDKRSGHLVLLAFVSSLVILVRPVNVLFLALPVFWQVNSFAALRSNFTQLLKSKKVLALSLLVFSIPLFVQLCYWHYMTGHWIINSYEGERFDFSKPHIINGLFSFRKGWFIYTPTAFLMFIGFFFLWKKDRKMARVLLSLLSLAIFIVFSWRLWWYGGSFGCRPLIEYFAVLALPLAALLEFVFSKKLLFKSIVSITLLALIGLNIFQSYQYTHFMIHYDRMSKAAYFKVWGRTNISFDEYEPFLISEHEYWDELGRMSKE